MMRNGSKSKQSLRTNSLIILCCLLVYPTVVSAGMAQTVGIASSPNPVGSGARALGMGGAFIAVADDATAASWNPGGLVQLETPEISVVGAFNHRTEDTNYEAFPEASGPQGVSTWDLNYLSGAYPFPLFDHNAVVSLNYQQLYDFSKKVRFSTRDDDPPFIRDNQYEFEQEGSLYAISPAFALQISSSLSVGVTLNVWENALFDNEWKLKRNQTGSGSFMGIPFFSTEDLTETYKFSGFNCNIGIMWDINSTFTLGAVFKSPFGADLKHDYRSYRTVVYPTDPENNKNEALSFSNNETLDMPMSYGVGLSARLSDALTLALDIYRTEWGDYVLHAADGRHLSPITGRSENESDVNATTQVRVGSEYLIIGEEMVIPIRAGLFYDPEPADGSPDDFWGLSVGSGISYDAFVYDIAYQYRFGKNVRSAVIGDETSKQDVEQHTVYMSVIYHF